MSLSTTVPVFETEIPGAPKPTRGKVRDIYDLGDSLLMVVTDRLSAFDVVLPNPVPGKGKVLSQISEFWFEKFADLVPNHIITTDVAKFPEPFRSEVTQLEGRTTLARKLDMLPIECVARGYLAGSGWKEYQESGSVCGIPLPAGLKESSRLPETIFTPATKATDGHDENIPYSEAERMIGPELAAKARDLTLKIYEAGAEFARGRGMIIADTKFEFGNVDGELVLADEVLTPDSSRFWPADLYEEGRAQASLDKQYVRDWLETVTWDKQPPAPALPDEIVSGLRDRYVEIFRILTGRDPV